MNLNRKFNSTIVVLLILLGFISSCGDKTTSIDSTDRKSVLSNTAEKAILPAFDNFLASATTLKASITTFVASPDETTLNNARASWLNTAKAWKTASAFNQGPVEDLFLAGAIDYASVHYPNIEKTISEATTIDDAFVQGKGSSLKGLKAIEYLLYGDGTSNTDIIATFTSKSGNNRKAYLQSLANNIHTNAQQIADAWSSQKGNYVGTFVAADGREAGASLGLLVNKLISQINTLKDERVGAPAGTRTNGTPQPELVEAIPSGQSFTLLKSEIEGIQKAYNANNTGGINTLLDKLNAKAGDQLLSQKIDAQFLKIYQKIDSFAEPINEAVISNRGQVLDLYTDLKQLQVLLEVDLVNNLGILLTFSDSDGD